MSKMIEINLRPGPKVLRQFGFVAVVAFLLLATLAWKERMIFSFGLGELRETIAVTFIILGSLSALFSLMYPRANLPLYIGLTLISYPIGYVLSHIIMGVIFFLVITPAGFLLRILGRDPMNRHFLRDAETYWVEVQSERPKESYFRQF